MENFKILKEIEQKVLWLSCWMIHNANHIRENFDGIKVGGHQASCASMVSMMVSLYFDVLKPEDRVAVKPHASPVFHAIQYLAGLQKLEKITNLLFTNRRKMINKVFRKKFKKPEELMKKLNLKPSNRPEEIKKEIFYELIKN